MICKESVLPRGPDERRAGDKAALVALEALALSRGATKVQMLAVSGAFHTELMEPAAAALRSALSEARAHRRDRSTAAPTTPLRHLPALSHLPHP